MGKLTVGQGLERKVRARPFCRETFRGRLASG